MNEIKPTDIYTYKTEGRVVIEIRHAEAWQAYSELMVAERLSRRYHDWRVVADAENIFFYRVRNFRTLLNIDCSTVSYWAE